jgi:hypothetical protein
MSHKPNLFFATVIATLSLLALCATSIASGIITPATLDEFWTDTENTYVVSTLPPLEDVAFVEVAPEAVVAPDARPF